jgi:hypothetical protein
MGRRISARTLHGLEVIGSEPSPGESGWKTTLLFHHSARLHLEGTAAEFYVGDVPGCDVAPPDYVADDEATVRAGLAGWRSPIDIKYMTSRGQPEF